MNTSFGSKTCIEYVSSDLTFKKCHIFCSLSVVTDSTFILQCSVNNLFSMAASKLLESLMRCGSVTTWLILTQRLERPKDTKCPPNYNNKKPII